MSDDIPGEKTAAQLPNKYHSALFRSKVRRIAFVGYRDLPIQQNSQRNTNEFSRNQRQKEI